MSNIMERSDIDSMEETPLASGQWAHNVVLFYELSVYYSFRISLSISQHQFLTIKTSFCVHFV